MNIDAHTYWSGEVSAWVKAFESLTQRERLVVSLYYYEGLSDNDIGGVISVATRRVTQVRLFALGNLAARMAFTNRASSQPPAERRHRNVDASSPAVTNHPRSGPGANQSSGSGPN